MGYAIILAGFLLFPTEEVRLINNFLQTRTEKCWTLDRMSNKTMISVAATGTGFYAYAVASKRGIVSRDTARQWIRTGFDSMLAANSGNDGWLYHFLDPCGNPYKNTEISVLDTVIFYAAAEKAAKLLEDKELIEHILTCKAKINLAIVTDEDGYFYHGFAVEDGSRKLLRSKYKNYSEGVFIYKYFDRPFKPVVINYDLPLFCYVYPLAFYQSKDWVNHLGKAIAFQLDQTGRFGYSATDSPGGYSVNSPYILSPLHIKCCERFFPVETGKMLAKLNIDPLTQSVSVNGDWLSKDRILLDDGILLLIKGKE